MATVKALYDYSYDYEGSKITFRNGEEFQLLSKANNDWWHVRRWKEGVAQDIYVPAVYVKEEVKVEKDNNPTYENVAELLKKAKKSKAKPAFNDKMANGLDTRDDTPPPAVGPKPGSDSGRSQMTSAKETNSPKPSPKHKPKTRQLSGPKGGEGREAESKPNGVPKSTPDVPEVQYAEPSPSTVRKGLKELSPPTAGMPVLGIRDGWKPGYALPVHAKPRSRSVNTEAAAQRNVSPPSEPTPNAPASPTGTAPGPIVSSRTGRIPPPVLPKAKPSQRPKSMIVTSNSPTEVEPQYDLPGEAIKSFLDPIVAQAARAQHAKTEEGRAAKVGPKPRPNSGSLGLRKTPSPKQMGADTAAKVRVRTERFSNE